MDKKMKPMGKVKAYKSPFKKEIGAFSTKVNKETIKKKYSGFKYESPRF